MSFQEQDHLSIETEYPHEWLRPTTLGFVGGESHSPLLENLRPHLLEAFARQGNTVVRPERIDGQEYLPLETELIITEAKFNEAVPRRKAPLFTFKRRFNLEDHPTIISLVSIDESELDDALDLFRRLRVTKEPNQEDFPFPGLPETALLELQKQTRRGGPDLGIARLIQAQTGSMDVIVVVGNRATGEIKRFIRLDLAGGHPEIEAANLDELVLRLMTFWSTEEAKNNSSSSAVLPQEVWQRMKAPEAIINAGRELGKFGFFIDPVDVRALSGIPVGGRIADFYSQGCIETFDENEGLLVMSGTGSGEFLDKRHLGRQNIALVRTVKKDLSGVWTVGVAGEETAGASSEAVEMVAIDKAVSNSNRLPPQFFRNSAGERVRVPFFRSKAHTHEGIVCCDLRYVKILYLDDVFYRYPVSCATQALAKATVEAVLRHINDPDFLDYQLYVIVQPCHGIWLLERWVEGTEPFAVILDYLENKRIQLSAESIPQGPSI